MAFEFCEVKAVFRESLTALNINIRKEERSQIMY